MAEPVDFSDIALGPIQATKSNQAPDKWSDLEVKAEPELVQTYEPSGLGSSEFSRGVARSHLNATSAIANFITIFGDTKEGAIKDIADRAAEEAGMIPSKAGSIKDVLSSPSLAPAYISRVVGELAPQAVLAYLAGGIGASVGAGLNLGKTGVRLATGAGMAATSIPQEVGHMYEEGGSKSAALAFGIPSGLLDSLSAERIIGKVFRAGTDEAKRQSWRQIVRDTVKEIPKAAGIESGTESAQELLALAANKSADSTFNLLTQDNGIRILDAAVAGVIGGGVLGGGAEVAMLGIKKSNRDQKAGQLRGQRLVRDIVNEYERTQPEPTQRDMEYAGSEMDSGPSSPNQEEGARLYRESQNRLTRSEVPTARKRAPVGSEMDSGPGGTLEGQPQDFSETPVERNQYQAPEGSELEPGPSGDLEGQPQEKTPPTLKQISEMPSMAYYDYAATIKGTDEAARRASLIQVPELLDTIEQYRQKALKVHRELMAKEDFDAALAEGAKAQLFREIIEAYTKTGGFAEKPKPASAKENPDPKKEPVKEPEVDTSNGSDFDIIYGSGYWSRGGKKQQPLGEFNRGFVLHNGGWSEATELDVKNARDAEEFHKKRIVEIEKALSVAGLMSDGKMLSSDINKIESILLGLPTDIRGTLYRASDIRPQELLDPVGYVKKQLAKASAWANAIEKQFKKVKKTDPEPIKQPDTNPEEPALNVVYEPSSVKKSELTAEQAVSGIGIPVQVIFDPGISKAGMKGANRQPETRTVTLEMTSNPRTKHLQMIYLRDSNGKNIWEVPASVLVANNLARQVQTKIGKGYSISDLTKLLESGLLRKVAGKEKSGYDNRAGYLLPNQKAERSVGAEVESVLEEMKAISPFLHAVGKLMANSGQLSLNAIEGLASSGKGGAQYAGKTSKKLAEQVASYFDTAIKNYALKAKASGVFDKAELTGLAQAAKLLKSDKAKFTDADVAAFTSWIAARPEYNQAQTPENEVSLDDPSVRGSSFGGGEGTGDDTGINPIGATWDPARTESILGMIEDKNPKLYGMFAADPENDKAWEVIEKEMVKFTNGDTASAEILTETIRQRRAEGWVASGGSRATPMNTPFRFITSTELYLRGENPFGIVPDKNGLILKRVLISKLNSKVSKEELAALKPLLDQMPERVNAKELADKIQQDGPQLEVVKLDAISQGVNPTESPEFIKMRDESNAAVHELDTLGYRLTDYGNKFFLPGANPGVDESIRVQDANLVVKDKYHLDLFSKYQDLKRKLQEFYDAQNNLNARIKANDSATLNYQSANPKPLKDMPGAVDILVRVPIVPSSRDAIDIIREEGFTGVEGGLTASRLEKGIKFEGGHFGGSDKNIVGWVRGYVETLPSGEKVFHVFEVQSDWAQQIQQSLQQQAAASAAGRPNTHGDRAVDRMMRNMSDPILSYYESVALKAAIRHARDLGITKIAISDGETAALTEGHDKVVAIARRANGKSLYNVNGESDSEFNRIVRKFASTPEQVEMFSNQGTVTGMEPNSVGELAGGGLYHLEEIPGSRVEPSIIDGVQYTGRPAEYKIVIDKEPFLSGDRQHYDFSLPSIMRNLTGESGVKVSFGQHQNVAGGGSVYRLTNPKTGEVQVFDYNEAGEAGLTPKRFEEIKSGIEGLLNQGWKMTRLREDMISSKVDISARVFDISKLDSDIPAQMFRSSLWSPSFIREGSEFHDDSNYQTGINAKGKPELLKLFERRDVFMEPEVRRLGLELIKRLPEKYLQDLTVQVAVDGSLEGEFIPWLKVARVAFDAKGEDVAVHEIAHHLGQFLNSKERSKISELRGKDIEKLRMDKNNAKFFEWLDRKGGSAKSNEYNKEQSSLRYGVIDNSGKVVESYNNPEAINLSTLNPKYGPYKVVDFGTQHHLYHLINDDEYFAHLFSSASRNKSPEAEGIVARVKQIVLSILDAIRAWTGNRDAYFRNLMRRFEGGDFSVDASGGMLFERNNGDKPKALQPITKLPQLRRFERVDRGPEEEKFTNALAHEQNNFIVGHVIDKIKALPRKIRGELTGLTGRAAVMRRLEGKPRAVETPLKHYAAVVNGLAVQQDAQRLSDSIEAIVKKIQEQNKKGTKASLAEAQAKVLDDSVKESLSSYKNFLLQEQKRAKEEGVAIGLAEAIKKLEEVKDSTAALSRVMDFMGDMFSLEELGNPDMSTAQLVQQFKRKLEENANVTSWQDVFIPSGGGKPGVTSDFLKVAMNIIKQNNGLVQDLITYKELSDPNFASIMKTGLPDVDEQIQSLTKKNLRSFMASYYSQRNAKDKARRIYLNHRARLKNLIEQLEVKLTAEDFLHNEVLDSPEFKSAMEAAAMDEYMSAELVRDGNGNDVLKRIYKNPLKKEQTITVIDGTTKKDYDNNIKAFQQIEEWYIDALESEKLDPLDKSKIAFELARIKEVEYNPAYDPQQGKRSPGGYNPFNVLANLVGNSLQFAMSKIGGRAAVQVAAISQARSEARRRVQEVRHNHQHVFQLAILEAAKEHNLPVKRWIEELAEPFFAAANSVGAKPYKVGETTWAGQKITTSDMEAFKAMKSFINAMDQASSDMELKTAKLHPIRVKEYLSGREITRPKVGHNEFIVPRRFDSGFIRLSNQWKQTKGNREFKDAINDLASFVSSGEPFKRLVLAHIRSTQKYPDYAGTTSFRNGYHSIYKNELNGNPPDSFIEVVNAVFDAQEGDNQSTKESIAAQILGEIDRMASRVAEEQASNRAADTPGSRLRVQSTGSNFMVNPRGQMVAPDSGYNYTVVDKADVQWLARSVLEVHEQMALDGLGKVKKMLEEYLQGWEKNPKAQKESLEKQRSGEDWLNYNEARQMLNQVNRHIELTSPAAFQSFMDSQFAGAAGKAWGALIQSLLQSATVLKNNWLGMNLRLLQNDAQWRGDGLWHGMPRWLLQSFNVGKNGIIYPMRDILGYVKTAKDYGKVTKVLSEESLRKVIYNPQLFDAAANMVGAESLKRAINYQRAKDLGAAGDYGIKGQVQKYLKMFTLGGELNVIDPEGAQKVKGGIESLVGLLQETGGGVMLPKALAPRKLEQLLNFQAIRYADRLLEELRLNILEAQKNREMTELTDPITDAELLGDSRDSKGNAQYMRNIFNRAGLNLNAIAHRAGLKERADLLDPTEWNSFVLEIAKELNMPSTDNRVQFKSGFGRLMGTLMGYGFWANERWADAMAGSSRRGFDGAAAYRAALFAGTVVAIGLASTALQRELKKLIYNEVDQTGKISPDNTNYRNAQALWEQTSPFWPILGSVMSQFYDARTGGNKLFNFLPVSATQQALQAINEITQTGNVFYPVVKFAKLWLPNTKIVLNRIPETEGLIAVNNASRSLRSIAGGDIELRTPSGKGGGAVRYSPVSTEIQMVVNEINKENPNMGAVDHYRKAAVDRLVGMGATRKDAERRFDLSVLTRFPQNTVYGRTLTPEEYGKQIVRLDSSQSANLARVEDSFNKYAVSRGLRAPGEQRRPRGLTPPSRGQLLAGLTRRSRTRTNRSRTLVRRNRRLVRA